MPHQLFVHGYLLLDDRKISKSLGNVVDPLDLIDVYGVDAVRFWCARAVSFGQDGNVSIDGLHERYERELGNDLGNLALADDGDDRALPRRGARAVPPTTRRSRHSRSTRATMSPARLDVYDITGALERIWEVVRALNRHVETTAPWQLAKDESARGGARRGALRPRGRSARRRDRARGVRPETAPAILDALGQPADARTGHESHTGSPERSTGIEPAAPFFPRVEAQPRRAKSAERPSDRHPCAPGRVRRTRRSPRARSSGRCHTRRHRRNGHRRRAGPRSLAEATAASSLRSGSTRTRPRSRGRRLGELGELLAHPKAVAVGETGLDNFHTFATLEQQQQLFRLQLGLAGELGKPVVIHSRAASAATADALAAFDGTVVLHCFSEPDLLPAALERRYYVSFAGNVTFPKAGDLGAVAAQVPADRLLAETDAPYLAPQPLRGKPNEPANVVHTLRVLAEARGESADELAAQIDAMPPRIRPAARPMRAGPEEVAGQHFLVDENILRVIGRLAELDEATTSSSRSGPGLGVLTRYLADRVALVHAVELDRSLEPAARRRRSGDAAERRRSCSATRSGSTCRRSSRPPAKLVANLPYNVATPIVIEMLSGLDNELRHCGA